MTLPPVEAIGAFFFISEAGLSFLRRSGAKATSDGGSMKLIWGVTMASVIATLAARAFVPAASSAWLRAGYPVGFAIFVVGFGLRWYSIYYLGRFFTVDVAVAEDHRVIDSGPYRHIRHPAYLGILLQFLGAGICMGNVVSLLLAVVGPTLVFLHRIRVEEAALSSSLGQRYRQYAERTKRLLPFLY
jgi:protein-S-isoprenylcysteine O-methyltransferase